MASSKPTGDVRSADLELAGRIRSGDGAAFEALYQQHAARLYNLAYRMAGTATRRRGPAAGRLLARLSQARQLSRRIVARHLVVPVGDESLPRRAAQSAVAHGSADRFAGRRGGGGTGGSAGARRGQPDRSGSGDRHGCRTRAGRRFCCTTSRASGIRRSARFWESRKGPRSRRCTRRRLRISCVPDAARRTLSGWSEPADD